MMLYINNNKVCPKCGTYRSSRKIDDKSICVSGHIMGLNKYITLKEFRRENEKEAKS